MVLDASIVVHLQNLVLQGNNLLDTDYGVTFGHFPSEHIRLVQQDAPISRQYCQRIQ